MVGDYISTSFNAGGTAHGAFPVGNAPTGGTDCGTATPNCDQATYTETSGQTLATGLLRAVDLAAFPNAASDHAAPQSALKRR